MAGLIEEATSMIDQTAEGPLFDAALIGSAKKAEPYKIAGYISSCLMAEKLGFTEAFALLTATL